MATAFVVYDPQTNRVVTRMIFWSKADATALANCGRDLLVLELEVPRPEEEELPSADD